MLEENRTPSERQKGDSASDLNSEVDVEMLREKETDEDNNLEKEQNTAENKIQGKCENIFLEESIHGDPELELRDNDSIEEQIPVVERPAEEERAHTSRNKRKKLDESMDIVTMIKTTQAALIKNAHSFKRRIIRKVKKRINILEGAIEQHTNAPLLVDTTKHVETLEIDELPIKNLQDFISFDDIVSKNPEKIEALKTLMTVATRRSANIKEAIPNVLKTLIGKEVQEGFSASGRRKNNLPFKTTFTYKTMRDVLLDYFHDTSDCLISSELSTWLARARDREGGRKNRT